MDLESHLRNSLWSPELESVLEGFSLPTYLDWHDHLLDENNLLVHVHFYFAERFLSYLDKVSIPYTQPKYYLQLLTLIRKNLNFITVMPPSIWNMRSLPSTVTALEKNSTA